MPVFVNGERIDDKFIKDEMGRLRPEYVKVFQDQSPAEQDAQLREWATENVIERVLIHQQAKKKYPEIPQIQIEKAYAKLMKNHGGEEKFYQRPGVSPEYRETLKQDIATQIRVDRLLAEVTKKVKKPSPEDAREYYENNIDQFMIPELVRAAHIVRHVDAEHPAEQALLAIKESERALKQGRSFEELADENSDCPGNGGDLGYFARGEMVQQFEDVVFAMDVGEVSAVFHTEFGFHIAKVLDKQERQPATFDAVKDELIDRLHDDARVTTMENYVDGLKEKATIVIEPEKTDPLEKLSIPEKRDEAKKVADRPHKQLNSLLIKPAGPDCNMACTYCFYLEKADLFNETKIHRMSEDVLREMTRQAMVQSGQHINFGWQGGEPTLMGLPFFEKAMQFQQEYGRGKSVGNGLQTNGILIDEEWAHFLHKYNFLVGLSLDGPEHIHNKYRHMRGGNGSWHRVEDSAKLMLDHDVSVNALSVVNDYSVQFPEEIYAYYKYLGLTFLQFIPCVETDPMDASKAAPFSVSPDHYGEFLCSLFDLWMADFKDKKPTTSIRYFDSLFFNYVGLPAPECTLLPSCGIYTVVEHNGDVFSCDFFVEPNWKLGNVMNDALIDMLNSDKQHEFGTMKAELPVDCKTCQWLKYCWGGCTKDRMRDPRDKGISHFCQSYKMFFTHAHSRMEKLASEWKREQDKLARQEKVKNAIAKGEMGQVGRNDPCPCGSGKKFKKCCGAA